MLAGLFAVSTLLGAPPSAAAATTPSDIRAMLIGWVNADRVARGLAPWRVWSALDAVTAGRALRVAEARTLSHAVAGGNVGDALRAAGVPWSWYGETLGMTGAQPSPAAARQVFDAWMASAPHRDILRSTVNNYVGVGVAIADDGSTWVSLIASQSPDHTGPVPSGLAVRRSGRIVTLTWRAVDPRLQTLTAGVRSSGVQVRVDDGAWRPLASNRTTTRLVLRNLSRGHWFAFRVRVTDRRGNLSAWTSPVRIRVP